MKKVLYILLIVIMLFSAHSEQAPDGSAEKVYFPSFDKAALEGFGYVLYPEKSGLLLSAYSDNAEIAVTIEEDEAADAEEFLNRYIEGMTRYAAILNAPEILPWETDGRKTRVSYRHNKASDESDAYTADVFASRISESAYLLIVFNSWDGDISRTKEKFIKSFCLKEKEVSKVHTAFLKNARADEDGNQYVSVDFCEVAYDASIFTVYAKNDAEERNEYRLSEDALIWGYDANASLYTQCLIAPEAQKLIEISADYYQTMGFDMIFQILFDANQEIVWMMHYNAF